MNNKACSIVREIFVKIFLTFLLGPKLFLENNFNYTINYIYELSFIST